MSLWIKQSENVPCQRVRKRDKPARQENRRRTVSTFVGKRDKPELKKILIYSKWRIFLSNNDVFIEEFQKLRD